MSASFTARFRSRCNACDEQIKQGDDAAYNPSGGIVHAECWGESGLLRQLERLSVICPECHLAKPCGCED